MSSFRSKSLFSPAPCGWRLWRTVKQPSRKAVLESTLFFGDRGSIGFGGLADLGSHSDEAVAAGGELARGWGQSTGEEGFLMANGFFFFSNITLSFFSTSCRLLIVRLTLEALRTWPLCRMASCASLSAVKAMKASRSFPPMMYTPPSGMWRSWKNERMSSAPALASSPCNFRITVIFIKGKTKQKLSCACYRLKGDTHTHKQTKQHVETQTRKMVTSRRRKLTAWLRRARVSEWVSGKRKQRRRKGVLRSRWWAKTPWRPSDGFVVIQSYRVRRAKALQTLFERLRHRHTNLTRCPRPPSLPAFSESENPRPLLDT